MKAHADRHRTRRTQVKQYPLRRNAMDVPPVDTCVARGGKVASRLLARGTWQWGSYRCFARVVRKCSASERTLREYRPR